MKTWVIELQDTSLHICRATVKPERSDYVNVYEGDPSWSVADGDCLDLIDGKPALSNTKKAAKDKALDDIKKAEAKRIADEAALAELRSQAKQRIMDFDYSKIKDSELSALLQDIKFFLSKWK